MKRILMRATLLAFALLVLSCGGEPSVASKSAAAYRDAQTKGVPVSGGHEHGGTHEMPSAAANAHAGHDMTASATTDHATMDHAAMGHAAMGHGSRGAMDHRAHSATRDDAHAQHQTATADDGHDAHAGMQHPAPSAGADPHAHHRMTATTTGAAPVAVSAPRSNTEMRSVQPAATLQPDAFDAPAPISVSEATKAAKGGDGHEGHAVYTCPMHPEVTSDKPGTCPKCGMALVKKD